MSYLEEVEFVENPEPRCPCLLLLDISGSMRNEPISELNKGLQTFATDLGRDALARRRVEVGIITFGQGGVQTQQEFVTADSFQAPLLNAGGRTPMGEAIKKGLDMVRQRKQQYQEHGIAYYRPWVFLITDGEPTDEWQSAALQVQEEEARKGLVFFAVGVEQANMHILGQIAAPGRPPRLLKGLGFEQLFLWLSASQQRVSHSKVGEQTALPPADGWAVV
ncbi:MAG TPA: VWA domain-containing protein [Ktedonobacteraceae bacterium]|jgi:uncharacterized protein YegL